MFYVYEWFIKDTNEIIYVGKGSKNRYKTKKHNKMFNEFISRYDCDSRIIKTFEKEEDAFHYEYIRVAELKAIGQCVCNIYNGGFGGETKSWTTEKRHKYSKYNVMKSQKQRERMSKYNPMKNKDTAKRVGIKHRKAVIVDGKYFDSVKSAAEYIGTWDIYVTECIRDKQGMCKGHKCEYANQQPSQTNTDNSSLEGSTTNE